MGTSVVADMGGRDALLAAARAELIDHGHAAISLRAVARRAGVSHAAPKYHFGDRAGLLTAVATEGFQALTAALRTATSMAEPSLAAVGRGYTDFGLANPALFDLMFRPSELHTDDPSLTHAQREAIGVLSSTVQPIAPTTPPDGSAAAGPPELALVSWALAHGLVVLTRDGALQGASRAPTPQAAADLARNLTDVYTDRITAVDNHPR